MRKCLNYFLIMLVVVASYFLAVGFFWIISLGRSNYWWHPVEIFAICLPICLVVSAESNWKEIIAMFLFELAYVVAALFYYNGFEHTYGYGYYSYCHEENPYTYLYVGCWCVWVLQMAWALWRYFRALDNKTLFGSFVKDRALFKRRRHWCRCVEEFQAITTVPISMIRINGDPVPEYFRKRAGLAENDPYYLEQKEFVMTDYYVPTVDTSDNEPTGPGFFGTAAILFYLFTKDDKK